MRSERLMKALAAFGVFRREDDGRFGQTAASELLRSDHPRSQRAWLECLLGGEMFEAWAAIESAVRTGRPSFDARHGVSWVEYYRRARGRRGAVRRGDERDHARVRGSPARGRPVPSFSLAVDVGGSRGSLLRRLLERNPDARGVLFDLPEVIERWRATRTTSAAA